jgi:hypothetical protein
MSAYASKSTAFLSTNEGGCNIRSKGVRIYGKRKENKNISIKKKLKLGTKKKKKFSVACIAVAMQ